MIFFDSDMLCELRIETNTEPHDPPLVSLKNDAIQTKQIFTAIISHFSTLPEIKLYCAYDGHSIWQTSIVNHVKKETRVLNMICSSFFSLFFESSQIIYPKSLHNFAETQQKNNFLISETHSSLLFENHNELFLSVFIP